MTGGVMISEKVKDFITAGGFSLHDVRQGLSIVYDHDHDIFKPGYEELSLNATEILIASLYRLLINVGFTQSDVHALIKHFRDKLFLIGKEIGRGKPIPVSVSTLQIIDYRWVTLDGDMWNFVDCESGYPEDTPLTSVAIALPVAVFRAVGKIAKLQRKQSQREEAEADRTSFQDAHGRPPQDQPE